MHHCHDNHPEICIHVLHNFPIGMALFCIVVLPSVQCIFDLVEFVVEEEVQFFLTIPFDYGIKWRITP
jgi:hypothetical protein